MVLPPATAGGTHGHHQVVRVAEETAAAGTGLGIAGSHSGGRLRSPDPTERSRRRYNPGRRRPPPDHRLLAERPDAVAASRVYADPHGQTASALRARRRSVPTSESPPPPRRRAGRWIAVAART